jgi:hypothetical protein
VAARLPVVEIDGVWVFQPIREGPREWGTAIISQVHGDRRRIHTARFALQIKGKERGKFDAAIEEVGSGPVEALSELLQDVRKRLADEEPPVPVDLELWFPGHAALVAARKADEEAAGDAAADAETDGEAAGGNEALEQEPLTGDETEGAAHVPTADDDTLEAEVLTSDETEGAAHVPAPDGAEPSADPAPATQPDAPDSRDSEHGAPEQG